MTWIFAIFTLFVGVNTFANERIDCSEAELRALFEPEVPVVKGSVQLIQKLLSPDIDSQPCRQELTKLEAIMKRGHDARASYLAFYTKHFPVEGDRLLVLTPEQEILRRLYAILESGNSRRGTGPPAEWEIRRQALREVTGRYGLPEMSEGDLEKLARKDSRLETAVIEFRRRQHVLREMMEAPAPQFDPGPNAFKAMMTERLRNLRIANLKAAVAESKELFDRTIDFVQISTGRKAEFKLGDLIRMDMRFRGGSDLPPEESKLEGLPKPKPLAWFSRMARKHDERLDFFEVGYLKAQHMTGAVTFKALNDDVFELAEEDFVELLQSLGPETPADFFNDQPIKHRFLLESTTRDAILANMVTTLKEVDDKTVMDLYQRLNKRVKSRRLDLNESSQFLSLEILAAGNIALNNDSLSDLLWSGWARHPRYWSVRRWEEDYMSLPVYGAKDEVTKRTKRFREVRAYRQQLRMLPEAGRRKLMIERFAKVWSKRIAKTAAAAGILGLLYSNWGMISSLPDFPFKFSYAGSARQGMNDSEFTDENYSFGGKNEDNSLGGAGPRPDQAPTPCGAKHNPDKSSNLIETVCKTTNVKTPLYFNFAKNGHLYRDDGGERYAQEQFRGMGHTHSDLSVDVNIPTNIVNGRIGLLQISDYQLVGLELFDRNNQRVEDDDIAVFQVYGNRQLYAEIPWRASGVLNRFRGGYTFRLHYTYNTGGNDDGIDSKLPAYSIKETIKKLNDYGFTQLAQSLDKVKFDSRDSSVSMKEIAQLFSFGANYTFNAKTWKERSEVPEPYQHFTRYLNRKGELWYQCTGSNNLMKTFLRDLSSRSSDSNLEFTSLVGWAGDESGDVERGTPRHRHTMAFRLGSYLELDATPPGSEQLSKKEGRQPRELTDDDKEDREEQRETEEIPVVKQRPRTPLKIPELSQDLGVLAERPRLPVPAATTNPEPKAPRDEPKEEKIKPKLTADDLARAELDRIFQRLELVRSLVVKSSETVVRAHSWTMKTSFMQIPGLRFLPMSRRLLDGYEGRKPMALTLAQIYEGISAQASDLSEEQAEEELNQLFKQEFASWTTTLERLDRGSDDRMGSTLEFLQHDPLRSRIQDLSATLATYPWGALLKRSLELARKEKVAKTCASEMRAP